MFCDPNFGMYERDYAICEHISKIQKEKNYPRYIFASTGKNRKDRIAKAVAKLNGTLKFWLSVQSMDHKVLENIKRSNIKLEAMTGLVESYSKLDLHSFSEFRGSFTQIIHRSYVFFMYGNLELKNCMYGIRKFSRTYENLTIVYSKTPKT